MDSSAINKSGFYSNRVLMSYDRNKYPYRFAIGSRGRGKSYAFSNLLANHYHRVKHLEDDVNGIDDMFVWVRLTFASLKNMAENVIDSKLQKKHNIQPRMISKGDYYEIYFNDKLVGHGMSLDRAPKYKGGVWNWLRYKYFILDEFQREQRERRTFNIVYNLRSLLESVGRFSTRMQEGHDYPYVIFMGNTVDEATDLLFAFDFMPLQHGMYKLPAKMAIIEYFPDGDLYTEHQKINPLGVLREDSDHTFGEKKLKVRDKVIAWNYTGERRYLGHLQINAYIRFEMWTFNKGLYVSNGIKTAKFENKTFTLRKLEANKGTYYSIDIHKIVRQYHDLNKIYFDKRLTASIFNSNIV